ncbi:hypothetical protein BBOV_III011110 [Babesia bovis T2Bo]|uniref:Uncharacterized protein n=1 Tax=Babesia bovis TaxID=5865 RepID=A7AQ29_BABBO|nr:hypothetical protein BBOV_III011110 [Babesia bovis T2Bo]EDO08663.1 hypothetical protein BBOV_III011110 [Babesia bovis T2Bo]|eukprot:XP_001612231.1 hypothetical protein [Babesia bovis T2Bo]
MKEKPPYNGNVRHERLWTPVDPSGFLRICCVVCENDIHSQLVLNGNSGASVCISCNAGNAPRRNLDVVSTGETLQFSKGAVGICKRIVDAEVIGHTQSQRGNRKTDVRVIQAEDTSASANSGDKDASTIDHALSNGSTNGFQEKTSELGIKKTGTHPDLAKLQYWDGRKYVMPSVGNNYGDVLWNEHYGKDTSHQHIHEPPLIGNIAEQLKKLPLKRNDCDVCRRTSKLESDCASGRRIIDNNAPCIHSLGLKHAPMPLGLTSDIDIKGDGIHRSYYSQKSEYNPDCVNMDYIPRRQTTYENVSLYDGHPEIDELLTYRHEEVHGEAYMLCSSPRYNVERLKDSALPGAVRLEELDTALLHHVASRVPTKPGSAVDVVSAVNEVTKLQKADYEGQFGFDKCVSMTGKVVDPYASKTQLWQCPEEFKIPGYRNADTPRITIKSTTRDSVDDAFADETTSTLKSYTLSIDELYDVHGLDKRSEMLYKEQHEEEYYDTDMSLDELIAKYVVLRKKPDCPPTILRTLKHLICLKMGKDKLYIRNKTAISTSTDSGMPVDGMMRITLRKILDTVQVLHPVDGTDVDEPRRTLIEDDDASVYTYSSVSLSSYFSVHEDVHIPADDRTLAKTWELNYHDDVVEYYGVVTVIDENMSQIIPNNCATVYCELVGDKISVYNLRGSFVSAAGAVDKEPILTVHIDASFTCTPPKRKNKSTEAMLRLNGLNYTLRGVNSSETTSEDAGIFIKLVAEDIDISKWWAAITSRQKLKSYIDLLENEHKLHLYSSNLDLIHYPNLRKVDLSGLEFNSHLEKSILKSYINSPLIILDVSHRLLKDDDLADFCNIWDCFIHTLILSHNALHLANNMDQFVQFINKTKVQRLYLDGNELSSDGILKLPGLFTSGHLKYLSLRQCTLHDSIQQALSSINKILTVADRVIVDVREVEASDSTLHYLMKHPFSRLRVATSDAHLLFPEYKLENFMDVHSKEAIHSLGALYCGRLISAREGLLKIPFRRLRELCRPRDKQYVLAKKHAFFEYRPPYLVMYTLSKKKKSKGKPQPGSIAFIVFVTSCSIAHMNDLRWLHVIGNKPRLVNATWYKKNKDEIPNDTESNHEVRMLVRAYSDAATKRWFEVISRTIAGIVYVKHLRKHYGCFISKHILSFCSRYDASHLVLYDLPYDKELWIKFFASLNSQSMLRVMDFCNKKLTAQQLTFDQYLFAGLNLDRLDFSFNEINLTDASPLVFNALLPLVVCSVYNISDNPLGDCRMSADLFINVCLKGKAVKVCMNRCQLGDRFLKAVINAIHEPKESKSIPHLEILELEGNNFSNKILQDFVTVANEFFPSLVTIRIHGSIATPGLTEEQLNEHNIFTMDPCSNTEPAHGSFTRIKHVKKEKRTTREVINKLLELGVEEAIAKRYGV